MFIVKFIVSLALGILNALFGGLVLSKLWGWFILPVFTGLPAITYLAAVGLMLTVNFLLTSDHVAIASNMTAARTRTDSGDQLQDTIVKNVAMCLVVYPMVLLGAYVWHLIIG